MAGKKRKAFAAMLCITALLTSVSVSNGFAAEDDESSESKESSEVSVDISTFDKDENERQRSELAEQTSRYNQELEETNQEIKEKQEYSKQLQQQIADLSQQIQESEKIIDELNSGIIEKQSQINDRLSQIQDRLDLLRKRLHSIHLEGDVSSLEIILGAKDFSDFIDKAEMMKSLSDYDDKLIKSLQAEMEIIAEEQRSLREDKEAVEQERLTLETNKKQINELSEENTRLIEELMTEADVLEKGIQDSIEMQKELEAALDAYNKELAEQARLERIRRQQEEAARRNQNGSGNDQSGSSEPEIVVESSGGYVWPCPGYTYLTSTFDEWRGTKNHGALDIAGAGIYGAKVVACYDGYVFSTNSGCTHDYGKDYSCGCGGGYGNYVMIDHGGGKISIYGHLSGVTVESGQEVVAGQLIGYVGSTGYSTGPHLHFEMQYNGVRYDPLTEY